MECSGADEISAFHSWERDNDAFLGDIFGRDIFFEIGRDSLAFDLREFCKMLDASSVGQDRLAVGVGSSVRHSRSVVCDLYPLPDVRSELYSTTNNHQLQKHIPTGRGSDRSQKARSKDSSQEKNDFLELWDAYTPRFMGKKLWSSISRGMKKRGHNRSRRSCESLACTLLEAFKTVADVKNDAMSVDRRTSFIQPEQFSQEWCEIMKGILKKEEGSKVIKKQSRIKSSGSPVQEPLGVEDSDDQSMPDPLGVEDSDDQPVQEPLAVEGNGDLNYYCSLWSTRDVLPRPLPIVSRLKTDSMSQDGMFNNSRMNDLCSRIKQNIEDEIKAILAPVASALQTCAVAVQKQQEAFLALEEKKLAMRRQKLQRPNRRHAGRFYSIRRSSFAMVSRPRKVQGRHFKLH